ncbi:MAG: hypothetical protein M1602_03490 [Firmicutes bacterium]|nr:hypothetical protein [Bacillota bacterium]
MGVLPGRRQDQRGGAPARCTVAVLVAAILTLGVMLAGASGCASLGRAAGATAPPGTEGAPGGTSAVKNDPADSTDARAAEQELVPYAGPMENIFFHPLIIYPERAFDGDSLSQGYDDWFVTVPEFKKILQALYRNDYILIDIRSLYEIREQDGKTVVERRSLRLPRGKKPLILSVDDLNYYDYMRENGNATRLVLDGEGNVAAESVDSKGETAVSTDDEIIPIVDAFVRLHPDFSLNGAKGVIALTGHQGILGYRTNKSDAPGDQEEREGAERVVERLKATGWAFASHGWGHLPLARISQAVLERDTRRWEDQVEPLVGPTPIYVFPHGSRVPASDTRMRYLMDRGFRVFLSVGPSPYLEATPNYLLMDRRHVDGMALRTQRKLLLPLFDAGEVMDPARLAPSPRP